MKRPSDSLILLLVFLLIGSASCGQGFEAQSTGSEVLLPWPNSLGQYSWVWVHLKTLSTPQKASGPAAEIYWRQGRSGDRFNGEPARPHLVKQGRRWLAVDVPSLQALSVYGLFERLLLFDQKLKIHQRLSWPRKIGIDIHIQTSQGRLPNNAIYDLSTDLIAVAPYDHEPAGLPTAVNHGVLAHEHFHAHFASAVRGKQNLFNLKMRADEPRNMVNLFILNSWNEGLADFYGAVYSGNPDFLSLSFSQATTRSLSGPLYPLVSEITLQDHLKNCSHSCAVPNSWRYLIYENGTVLARWLYLWGQRLDPVRGPERLLQEMMKLLPTLLQSFSAVIDNQTLTNGDFLQAFLKQQTLPIPAESCEELKILYKKINLPGCQ